MLNFFNSKKISIAITGGMLSTLAISTAALAQVERRLDVTPKTCSVSHSRIGDEPVRCQQYWVTYNPEDKSYGHHFLFNRSGSDRILLFSPEHWGDGESRDFEITGMMLVYDDERVFDEGSGRCQANTYGLHCSFYSFKLKGLLSVNIQF